MRAGASPSSRQRSMHGHLVELIRALAAAAMLHAGNHEQAKPIALIGTHFVEHRAIEVDGVAGRDGLIGPTVIEQKLSAMFFKRRKIGGVGVDAGFVGQLDVAIQIELVKIVIGVLVPKIRMLSQPPPGCVGVLFSAAYCSSPPG